jgi:hypothetical protein
MAVEQIRSDSRAEKWFGSRRKILMSAQGLQFFSEPPAALLILLFQHHATSEMRGCLSGAGASSPTINALAFQAMPSGDRKGCTDPLKGHYACG